MRDIKERDYLRAHFETEPGKGHLAEQLMGERENALAQDDDATVLRVEAQLHALGYQTPEERADAARARKADADRRAREQERIRVNRGEGAARDDHAGGPEAQKAGVADGKGDPVGGAAVTPPSAESAAPETSRKQPPRGRTGKPGKQETG